jgi:hypothetical protein
VQIKQLLAFCSTAAALCLGILQVKYVRRYGDLVHSAWAENGLAPQLLRVDHIPGGWHAVIMEALLPRAGWVPATFAAGLRLSPDEEMHEHVSHVLGTMPAPAQQTARALSGDEELWQALCALLRDLVTTAHSVPLPGSSSCGTTSQEPRFGAHGDLHYRNLGVCIELMAAPSSAAQQQVVGSTGFTHPVYATALPTASFQAGGSTGSESCQGSGPTKLATECKGYKIKATVWDFDW